MFELLEDKYSPESMQAGATDSSIWDGLKLGTSGNKGIQIWVIQIGYSKVKSEIIGWSCSLLAC